MSRSRLRLIIFIVLLLAGTVRAQPSSAVFPTQRTLETTIIPQRDNIDLARRLLEIHDIPAPPTSAPQRQLGEQALFWIDNYDDAKQISATLRAIGEHIYLWVEDGADVNDADVQRFADAFDQKIYPQEHTLWGMENSPGIDGETRVHGLFAFDIGGRTLGYYTRQNVYPQEIVPKSNEHEMFVFNLNLVGWDLEQLEPLAAHEFQHMIRDHLDANEDTWLSEGFSVFTELYLGYGYDNMIYITAFLLHPHTQLNAWTVGDDNATLADYGASLLFLAYFYQRYGLEAMQMLSADPANGMQSVSNVLARLDAPPVENLFADWVVANGIQDNTIADGRYGYRDVTPDLLFPVPIQPTRIYPFHVETTLNQYAADYYALPEQSDAAEVTIRVNAPDTVPLVQAQPASGRWMWYSNRADVSDSTLTRAFDLSDVQQATLRYSVWYDIEEFWDFGFVMVSDDGGATWTPLQTPHTAQDDPHFTGYGPGYTGQSDGWIEESVSLDAYAGKRILVRFEMITDDSLSQTGMLIDDVGIAEIGYASDFEDDTPDWQAEGWVRIDNVLPQDAWIQVVQRAGDAVYLTRWRLSESPQQTVPLVEDAQQRVVIVSPIAPVTTVPMPYILDISAPE